MARSASSLHNTLTHSSNSFVARRVVFKVGEADVLIWQSKRAHKDTGIHYFGLGIDEDGYGTVGWGGTPAYGKMTKLFPTTAIRAQHKDWEALFRSVAWLFVLSMATTTDGDGDSNVQIAERGGETGTVVARGEWRRRAQEIPRDHERRIISESLRLDLRELFNRLKRSMLI